MSRLYIFDLDDTLFNTNAFMREVGGKLGIKPSKRHDLASRTYRAWRLYIAQARGKLEFIEADNRYLFDDAMPTIRALQDQGHTCVIMSTGIIPWQRFKLSLCPKLKGLKATIVLRNKGYGLYQRITKVNGKVFALGLAWGSYDSVVVVDDLLATFKVMGKIDGVERIRIRRPNNMYDRKPTPSDIHEITHLSELLTK